MTLLRLIKSSFLFYFKRQHLPVMLGTMLSCGILTGALIIGDSVSYSLKQMTLNRLGKTEFAMNSGERHVRAELANELGVDLQVQTAPVLQLKGIAMTGGGQNRVNHVQLNGVDKRFWAMARKKFAMEDTLLDQVAINVHLARKMSLKINDELILRVNKINYFPLDAPFARDMQKSAALRVTVSAILDDRQFGSFGLQNSQVPPYNVFIPLPTLQNAVDSQDQVNMILVANNNSRTVELDQVNSALRTNFNLADASLTTRHDLFTNTQELISSRVFIEPVIIDAINQTGLKYNGFFGYFVNQIQSNGNTTPYSFISAPGLPLVPEKMPDSCIILNQWAADDLQASIGDKIIIDYYIIGSGRDIVQQSTQFTLYSVVPMQGRALDKNLVPQFPGLVDAENCRDWDPGIPIDLDKIRKKDEDYWDSFRGTPKAFVTLAQAQKMWGNRYGNLTLVRFSNTKYHQAQIDSAIRVNLKPETAGLFFAPVLADGLQASANAQDFGGLFLGLSFFIIVAGLVLTGLLVTFGLENRAAETGLLLGIGFTNMQVKTLFFIEFLAVAVPGALAGILFGIVYNQFVLWALGSLWKDVVGEPLLMLDLQPQTLLTGFLITLVVVCFIIAFILFRQTMKSITDLQHGTSRYQSAFIKKSLLISRLITAVSLSGVLIIMLLSGPGRGKEAAGVFFGAGTLLLIAAVSWCNIYLVNLQKPANKTNLTLLRLGILNSSRNKKNSLAIITLLACGIFLVIAQGANRHGTLLNADKRDSGTGGFAFWGETVSPILHNLNNEKGQAFLNMPPEEAALVKFVQCRLKEGDEASCLNLNMVRQPKILGVPAYEFDNRNAFTFIKTIPGVNAEHPWLALNHTRGENIIPAIVDQTVLTWNLYMEIGDTLYYQSENGDSLKLYIIGSLANSLFQGHVLISDSLFTAKFPTIGGYKVFLADAPQSLRTTVEKELNFSLQNYGLELVTAPQRLAAFNKIENTYLSIFLSLGGLGLLLGSIGLGIVVVRNVLERRSELALLTAVGYKQTDIYKYLLSEHLFLLLAGVVAGSVAALISILPVFSTPGAQPPTLSIIITILSLLACGFLWIYLAVKLALHQNLLPALRSE